MATDVPFADFDRKDAKETAWLNSLPVCDNCGEPIQDEIFYEIEGSRYCPDCLADFRRYTDDYID